MEELLKIIANMAPEEALSKIATITQTLLADLDSDTRERFLMDLIGQSGGDKVTGMVHL
jgi:hypothetical protein